MALNRAVFVGQHQLFSQDRTFVIHVFGRIVIYHTQHFDRTSGTYQTIKVDIVVRQIGVTAADIIQNSGTFGFEQIPADGYRTMTVVALDIALELRCELLGIVPILSCYFQNLLQRYGTFIHNRAHE